jgi:hypothetical protein
MLVSNSYGWAVVPKREKACKELLLTGYCKVLSLPSDHPYLWNMYCNKSIGFFEIPLLDCLACLAILVFGNLHDGDNVWVSNLRLCCFRMRKTDASTTMKFPE